MSPPRPVKVPVTEVARRPPPLVVSKPWLPERERAMRVPGKISR